MIRLQPRLIVAALGVCLFAAGGVSAVTAYRTADDPGSTVAGYFAALVRADAGAALAYGTVPAGGDLLLSDAVLAGRQAAAPVRDVRITSEQRTGTRATVAVRYSIGAGSHGSASSGADAGAVGTGDVSIDDEVQLVRNGGRWRLTRSAIPVRLSVVAAAGWAAVAGPEPFDVPSDVQLSFPGPVPVVYRAAALVVGGGAERAVRFAGPAGDFPTEQDVAVQAAVAEPAWLAVTDAVHRALDTCLAAHAIDPFCPEPTAPGNATLRPVPDSFVGRVAEATSWRLSSSVGGAGANTITVDGQVQVTGSWKWLDFDNVAQPHTGLTTLAFQADVPIAAPTSVHWARPPA